MSYFNTIEGWKDLQPHAHRESDEFFLVLRGAVVVEVEGERVTIGPREFCGFPRGAFHQVVEVQAPVECLVIRNSAGYDKIYRCPMARARPREPIIKTSLACSMRIEVKRVNNSGIEFMLVRGVVFRDSAVLVIYVVGYGGWRCIFVLWYILVPKRTNMYRNGWSGARPDAIEGTLCPLEKIVVFGIIEHDAPLRHDQNGVWLHILHEVEVVGDGDDGAIVVPQGHRMKVECDLPVTLSMCSLITSIKLLLLLVPYKRP